jgi:hypothetical protein
MRCPSSTCINPQGFNDLGSATINSDSPGIRWTERSRYCQNIPNVNDQSAWSAANHYDPGSQYVSFNCVMPLDTIYRVFIALWIGFFVLAIYLDVSGRAGAGCTVVIHLVCSHIAPAYQTQCLQNIIKNEFGVRR